MESIQLICPSCGEPVELDIDETGGTRQSYVEDCPVCCQPWQVEISLNPENSWTAVLQKIDA